MAGQPSRKLKPIADTPRRTTMVGFSRKAARSARSAIAWRTKAVAAQWRINLLDKCSTFSASLAIMGKLRANPDRVGPLVVLIQYTNEASPAI